jgi:hypothetical protein
MFFDIFHSADHSAEFSLIPALESGWQAMLLEAQRFDSVNYLA